ncbi:Dihydrodipicolinate synthetase family [Aspergillus sp. HF37]|nr:Dihydrodipicolinate synthetase family [Aspergillus sp. HF37]
MTSHGVPPPPEGASAAASSTAPSETPRTIFSRSHLDETYSSTAVGVSEENIRRVLKPGLYIPTVAFFKDNEELDEGTTTHHAVRMARAGAMGLVVQGTFGEAAHLSHTERCRSTGESIELCHDARASGGDYALVLPPSAYSAQYTPATVKAFFTDIASASPLPVLLYNYPAATGVELDTATIVDLARHPNIVGCKLTCNNMGKLVRVAAATRAATPADPGSGFMCFAGSAEVTVQALVGGGSGIVAGLGNVAPKTCVQLVELQNLGRADEARALQGAVARADLATITAGVVGAKSALRVFYGYGGFGRRPLPRPEEEQEVASYAEEFREIVEMERAM